MKKLLILAMATTAVSANAATLFDAITGGSSYTINYATSSTAAPVYANQAAENITFAAANQTLSSMDINLGNAATANYSDVKLDVRFYSSFTGSFSGATPEMSGLINTSLIDLGAVSVTTGFFNQFLGLALNPTTIAGSSAGVVVTILADAGTGLGLQPANNLQVSLNLTVNAVTGANATYSPNKLTWHGVGAAAGSVPLNTSYSYFGTAAPTTENNLDVRFFGAAATPEPATYAVFGLGALMLIRRRKSAKKA